MPRSPLVVKKGSRQRRRGVFVHADAGVGHSELHGAQGFIDFDDAGAQGEPAAVGHRIDGIEDQVGQGHAQLAFHAHDGWGLGRRGRVSSSMTTPRC